MPADSSPRTPARLDGLIGRCLGDDPLPAIRTIEREHLWEYVASHAWRSHVGGVLFDRLGRLPIDVPISAARQLEAYHEHVAAANAYKRSCIEPVLARLQACEIDFLLLKGAALNAILYDDPGLRSMVDVDVLIRGEDVSRADRVLRESDCSPGADLVRDDFYPRYYYEREYFTPNHPPVKIDLHVRPFRPLRYARTVPADALWDAPSTVALGKLAVRVPNPENMLIHLAVHAACHGLQQVRWLYDIHRWIARFGSAIDADALADTSHRWRLDLPVRRGLEKVQTLFDSSDAALSAMIRRFDRSAGWLDRVALAQAPHGERRPMTDVLVNCLATPGLGFRFGYLRAVLLPGRGHLGQLYPRRHPGWPAVAHLIRAGRGLSRLACPTTEAE